MMFWHYLSARETIDCSVLGLPLLKGLGVHAVLVPDSTVPLNDANTLGTSPGEVPHGVEADITQALDNEGLLSPAGGASNHTHVLGLIDEVLQTVEDTPASSRCASMDTSLNKINFGQK